MHATEYGYCQCGCGLKTPLAPKTNRAQGQIKGQPNRYIQGHTPKRHPDYVVEDRGYETPCWIWQGGHDRNGYGILRRKAKPGSPGHSGCAHVWYWKQAHGEISDSLELDHLCRVPACVNPDHIEAITHEENVKRGISFSAVNARKTHCEHGHEFTPENTYIRKGTKERVCRECRRIWWREWYARQKAAKPKT